MDGQEVRPGAAAFQRGRRAPWSGEQRQRRSHSRSCRAGECFLDDLHVVSGDDYTNIDGLAEFRTERMEVLLEASRMALEHFSALTLCRLSSAADYSPASPAFARIALSKLGEMKKWALILRASI